MLYFIFGATCFGGVWILKWIWNKVVAMIEKHNAKLEKYGKEKDEE